MSFTHALYLQICTHGKFSGMVSTEPPYHWNVRHNFLFLLNKEKTLAFFSEIDTLCYLQRVIATKS